MASESQWTDLDSRFYLSADEFFPAHGNLALTYDDVTLATRYSEVLPSQTVLATELAEGLRLNVPIISADMDTVTEWRMATAMALNGGLGLIHYNMSDEDQLVEVSRVKNHILGLIQEPVKVTPDLRIGDVLRMIERHKFNFSTFPVVDGQNRLVGLLPGHVVKQRYAQRKVAEAFTPRAQVQTIHESELGSDPISRADRFFTDHPGIHKLLVVDSEDHLRGLFTLSDVEKITLERKSQF
ncbi:MAG: IMP dehydrogenase, partial [Verrucomicrobiia bacterium]